MRRDNLLLSQSLSILPTTLICRSRNSSFTPNQIITYAQNCHLLLISLSDTHALSLSLKYTQPLLNSIIRGSRIMSFPQVPKACSFILRLQIIAIIRCVIHVQWSMVMSIASDADKGYCLLMENANRLAIMDHSITQILKYVKNAILPVLTASASTIAIA